MIKANPYQSPTPLTNERGCSEELKFRGEVSFGDVAEIGAQRRSPSFLFGFVMLLFVPMISFVSFRLILGGIPWVFVVVPLLGTISLLTVLVFALNSPRRHAQRMIEQSPQLVGPVDAKLNADGYFYLNPADGLTHQITWSLIRKVVVTAAGIRLDWAARRSIVLPAHCAVDFPYATEHRGVVSLIDRFREQDTSEPAFRVSLDWSETPEGCLRFNIPMQLGVTQNAKKQRREFGIVVALALLTSNVALAFVLSGRSGMGVAAGLIATLLWSAAQAKRRQNSGLLPPLQAYQWGWLDRNRLHVAILDITREVTWDKVQQVKIASNRLFLLMPDHSSLEILSDQFVDDDWSRIMQWKDTLPAKLNVLVRNS
ncbi:MAG: hypothetical protein AB8B91_00550 [Rubripirellula sp.]